MNISEKYLGSFQALLATVFFGLNSFFFLPLHQAGFSIDSALAYRFLLASLIVFIILLFKKQSFKISWSALFSLALVGFTFFVSSQLLFNALTHMPSGIVITIAFTNPIYVMIFAILFFKEKVEPYKVFFSLLACFGIAILSGFFSDVKQISFMGVALTLMSASLYAVYFISLQRVQRNNTDKLILIFYIMGFCGIFALIYALLKQTFMWPNSFSQGAFLVCFALVTGVLSNLFLIMGIKKIGSVLAAILGATEPITAVIVGVLIFNESMSFSRFIGIIIVLGSVILLSIFPVIWKKIKQ